MFERLAPLGLVLLAACGQSDLYSNVSEREANDMVVTLGEAGIAASKRAGSEDSFTIAVPRDEFGYAMSVLNAADFPRDANDTMAEMLKKKSLVSPESEQRLRANALLTENLNRTLAQIDGVQVARVHVVSPKKNRLGQADAQPTASVFIKHRRDADLASETAQVKILVANAVEDLSAANVSVALFAAAPTPVRAEPPVERAAAEMAAPLLGGLGALALGVVGFRAMRKKRADPAGALEGPGGAAAEPRA